jgi:hypothetical protein
MCLLGLVLTAFGGKNSVRYFGNESFHIAFMERILMSLVTFRNFFD